MKRETSGYDCLSCVKGRTLVGVLEVVQHAQTHPANTFIQFKCHKCMVGKGGREGARERERE